MKVTDKLIIVEQTFSVTKEKLWNAITALDQMKQWYFENIDAFEPTVGFETRFVIEHEGRIFPHLWKVIAVEPNKKIAYNWKYEGYTGDSVVTFALVEEENGVKLILTHKVLKSFPQNIPEFTRESCLDGWDYFIKKRLKNYISNK